MNRLNGFGLFWFRANAVGSARSGEDVMSISQSKPAKRSASNCLASRLAAIHEASNDVSRFNLDNPRIVTRPPFAERAASGFIGLQHHSPAQVEGDASIRFRNVLVQRL